MAISARTVAAALVIAAVQLAAAQLCGATAGVACGTPENNCCSVANYCGGDADYCGLGCQPLWSFNGECKVLPAPNVTVVTQCLDPKQVAITFDDGPFVYSADIAAAFTAAGGAVTFFINGLNFGCIYNFADGLIAARAAGHQLASHTWSHKDLQTLTAAEITDEVQKLNVAMKKILGAAPAYVRPPYGSYNRDALFVLAENNFTHVAMWDADSGDSTGSTFEQEKDTLNALDTVNGHVILNHDVQAATAQELTPFLITWAQERGLEMVTLGTCRGQPSELWYHDYVDPETRNPTWTCDAPPSGRAPLSAAGALRGSRAGPY